MYYVNETDIRIRLACLPDIADALAEAAADWKGTRNEGLAQERALHLAAEIVTDVGSSLIDGFIMRDASSYEDIVDIIAQEEVISGDVAAALRKLVTLRRSLVQNYYEWPRPVLHPMTPELPDVLRRFAGQVESYLRKELSSFS